MGRIRSSTRLQCGGSSRRLQVYSEAAKQAFAAAALNANQQALEKAGVQKTQAVAPAKKKAKAAATK
jgi:hypothetical protein